MPKLWLVFNDEKGGERRVEVDRTPFVVGRHSDVDLSIADSRLSREHVRIEWKTDKFVVSDAGSSNGTTLNGEKLEEAVGLKNEDKLDLGGAVMMTVELEGAEPADKPDETVQPAADEPDPPSADAPDSAPAPPAPAAASIGAPSGSAASGGIPTAIFFIAPLLGIFVLAAVIGAVVLFGGGEKQMAASDTSDYEYSDDEDEPVPVKDEDEKPKATSSSTSNSENSNSTGGPVSTSLPGTNGTDPTSNGESSETAAVERNGAAFIRQIALNDPKAFLTGEQAARVNARIKQLGRSTAIADNIGSARKNAAAIKTLAEQKNLKPQFLAAAAMTKLGTNRGDVLQAAQNVVAVYEQLRIQIGNENFDDALLMVAAYDQGAAGEAMKLRNMLQDLATKSNEGARTIRSIWFLEKNGKISQAEFDRALSFLAIGTISQNPKEFGVNAEALRL